jgi:putrescine transport system substrate-binding protein
MERSYRGSVAARKAASSSREWTVAVFDVKHNAARNISIVALEWTFSTMLQWFLRISFSVIALGVATSKGQESQEAVQTLNLLAWSDYFDPNTLANFETETGIRITYDTYTSSAALEATLAGPNDYDVVVIDGPRLQKAIAAGRLQKLSKDSISHIQDISPEVIALMSAYDPGNQYAVNYAWYTTGLAFNVGLAKARLGGALPNSWETILRPEILKRFADCGVEVIDSPVDLFATTLRALKLPLQSRNPANLKLAADLLFRLKPYIRRFTSTELAQALAGGEVCLAIGVTGDAVLARNRAQEANNGVEIGYNIPKEGALVGFDNLVVPSQAPHRNEAYQLINFLMRPEIAARNSHATGLATAILSAVPQLDRSIAQDPSIYPPADIMKRLFIPPVYERWTQDLINREWARIKSGK